MSEYYEVKQDIVETWDVVDIDWETREVQVFVKQDYSGAIYLLFDFVTFEEIYNKIKDCY